MELASCTRASSCWNKFGSLSSTEVKSKDILDNCVPQTLRKQYGKKPQMTEMVRCSYTFGSIVYCRERAVIGNNTWNVCKKSLACENCSLLKFCLRPVNKEGTGFSVSLYILSCLCCDMNYLLFL